MMQAQFKEAFDAIEASEVRVNNTTHAVLASMRKPLDKPVQKRWGIMIAVAMACLLFVRTSVVLYFTPTVVVSVDINPSLEMEINRFNRVVDVKGYNEDGVAFANALNIKHMSYSEAMDAIMASDTVNDLMARDGDLTIAVVPTRSVAQSDEIAAYVNQCTSRHENAHCYTMSAEAHHQAHELGLSCGRYQAYEVLSKADSSITPEQLNAMSMKEIRERMAAYDRYNVNSESDSCGERNGICQNHGYHHGKGQCADSVE